MVKVIVGDGGHVQLPQELLTKAGISPLDEVEFAIGSNGELVIQKHQRDRKEEIKSKVEVAAEQKLGYNAS
nr:hypothetical protein [Aneurinibacillus terranovensis]